MRVLLSCLISLIFMAAPVSGLAAEKLTNEELDKVSASGDLCSLFGLASGCSVSFSSVIDGSSTTTSTITSTNPDNGGVTVSQTTSSGGSTITQTNSFDSSFSCTGSCSITIP